MATRTEQKEKRRQEILEAGLDLFIRRGYAATKITDIADQVGMSTGLMFHYFESKEKLYETLIQLGISGPQSLLSIKAVEPIDFFKSAAEQVLFAIKNETFVAKMFVLMGQAIYNEAAPPAIQSLVTQIDISPSVLLIEAGQKNKTIRDGNPHALALAYWAAIQGIAEELALQPDAPCPEADWIVDIIRRKSE